MAEKSIMNEQRLANKDLVETMQLKTKRPFVEPLLVKHETLIENTLGGGGGAPGIAFVS